MIRIKKTSISSTFISYGAMREQVAENARRHDALVMEQIRQNEKLYRQRENYNAQVTTKLDELRYQEYINDRYPSYWDR